MDWVLVIAKIAQKIASSLITNWVADKVKDRKKRKEILRTIQERLESALEPLESVFKSTGLPEHDVEVMLEQIPQLLGEVPGETERVVTAMPNARLLAASISIPPEVEAHGIEEEYRQALEFGCAGIFECVDLLDRWEKHAWDRNFRELKEVRESLERSEQREEAIERAVVSQPQEELRDLESTYRKLLSQRHDQAPMGTLYVTRSKYLSLDALYVSQNLRGIPRTVSEEDLERLREGETEDLESVRREVLGLRGLIDSGGEVGGVDVFSRTKRAVVVGAPGSGKTTLLEYLMLLALRGQLKLNGSTGKPLPLLLRLRDLQADAWSKRESMPDPTGMLLMSEGNVFRQHVRLIEAHAKRNNFLFLIDGLDEIPEAGREVVCEWIEDLVGLYPNSYFLLSSRPYGYEMGRLAAKRSRGKAAEAEAGFEEWRLCEFDEGQIEEYVKNWVTAVRLAEAKTRADAEAAGEKRGAEMLEQAKKNPYVMQLATNPLYLSGRCPTSVPNCTTCASPACCSNGTPILKKVRRQCRSRTTSTCFSPWRSP